MNNAERIANLKAEKYQELFGVNKTTFKAMLEILEADYRRKHKQGGRPPKLSVLDKLIIMLQYYKEYRTMECVAFDYGVRKSTICDAIHWAEETLIADGRFHLPSKRALLGDDSIEVVILDVTECETERPKKKQKRYYSGKKKRHTLKLLIVIDAKTRRIICIAICGGRKHDFRLFCESGICFRTETEALADKGFIGIQHIHENSTVPMKSSKKNPLTKEEKKRNAEISKRRIYIEHTNRLIKRFHILSSRYRNKQKRFGLRASLICGIYNFQYAV